MTMSSRCAIKGQHLEGDDRLFVFRGVTAWWNDGNRVFTKKCLAEDEIASKSGLSDINMRSDILGNIFEHTIHKKCTYQKI